MGIKPLTETEIKRTLRAYEKCATATEAADKLGIPRSTLTTRLRKLRATGRLEKPTPQSLKPNGKALNLAAELRNARPKTWWDQLSSDEQKALLQIKSDHLQDLHRITIKEIHDRCRRAMPRLTVGYEKFKRWITNERSEEPETN